MEFAGWICPLTPLEVDLRMRAGEVGYAGGFIERYVTSALYPQGLTREIQVALGVAVITVNVAVYVVAIRRAKSAARRGEDDVECRLRQDDRCGQTPRPLPRDAPIRPVCHHVVDPIPAPRGDGLP